MKSVSFVIRTLYAIIRYAYISGSDNNVGQSDDHRMKQYLSKLPQSSLLNRNFLEYSVDKDVDMERRSWLEEASHHTFSNGDKPTSETLNISAKIDKTMKGYWVQNFRPEISSLKPS